MHGDRPDCPLVAQVEFTFRWEIPADGDITATITFAGLDWETKGTIPAFSPRQWI